MESPFETVASTAEALAGAGYLPSREIATAVLLGEKLGKPLLVEGPAGVGKTELAAAISRATGRPMLRLQCYEGLDEAKALYEWEYAKQLLWVQLVRERLDDAVRAEKTLQGAADRLAGSDAFFFSERFLLERPILKALRADEKVVLLLDEVDKADPEFEAFLLEVLSDFQVTVPELGTFKARHHPTVVLTSNAARELSDALKRRCLHLFVDYPTAERELAIVRAKVPEASLALAERLVSAVQRLRGWDLRKAPSIAETIDWARALVVLHADRLDPALVRETLGVVLKHEADRAKVLPRAIELLS